MKLFLNGRETLLDDFVDDDLARAVVISLFSWRRASSDDDLPGKSREGWWADTFSDNDPIGSKLWLLSRSKLTDETLIRAKEYAEDSLRWMVADGVAGEISVEAERDGADRLNLLVTITKPGASEMMMRFQDVWGK